jgi:hypothetical protein
MASSVSGLGKREGHGEALAGGRKHLGSVYEFSVRMPAKARRKKVSGRNVDSGGSCFQERISPVLLGVGRPGFASERFGEIASRSQDICLSRAGTI